MLIGAGMGILAGLTGVGGGIFLSPLLLMLGWAGTKQTSAVAAPFILVNSLAGARCRVHRKERKPARVMSAILAPAVLIGGWLGAEYGSRRFANPLVRRLLAVVLALAGAKMILAYEDLRLRRLVGQRQDHADRAADPALRRGTG